jgi:hypothetical protein
VIVYVAGPITLGGMVTAPELIERNTKRFYSATARLVAEGHEVLNPVMVPPQPNWESYMKLTIPMVCRSDKVVLLPDWKLSRGARLEVFLALELGIEVEEIEGEPGK